MSEPAIKNPLTGPSPEYWEGQHKIFADGGHYINLSGYGINSYNDTLETNDLVSRNQNILEIGVGTCNAIRELVLLGKAVSALDVCPTALCHAHKAGAHVYTAPEKLPSNAFGLALCHLVSQHLPDDVLLPLLTNVIRSLTDTGTLAIQAADVPGRTRQGYQFAAAGNNLRDEKEMTAILEKAGAKRVKLVKTISVVPAENVVWLGFHAGRA
jgi:SAM-dependent methyltransferase